MRRILSIVVPIAVIVLVIGFILTFAIVPMGGGGFAALGDLEKQPDRYVQMVTAPQIGSAEHKRGKAGKMGLEGRPDRGKRSAKKGIKPEERQIVGNQGLLSVLGGGVPDQSLSGLHGEGGGYGGLGLRGTGSPGGGNVVGSSGRPSVMGSLDKEIIRRVIRSHHDQIKYCYSKELARNSDLAGKVAMRFTIGPTGRVTGVGTSHGTAESAALERCIADSILTWRFPQPKGGGSVVVNYPFLFKSSGKPSRPTEPATEQLAFIPARGYFKNTYLPGDPALEWLRRRLEKDISLDGRPLNLERAVVPYVQPFDPPEYDGLAVYLNADRRFLEEPTRITVQVGLKGSERHARRRACLNAALVVDLRGASAEENRRILWSLADAMAGDLQAGDRFYLVAAGVEKPLRVEPARFDSSTVRRHLAQALGEVEAGAASPVITGALDAAYNALKGKGADDAPIGANLVLLATAAPLAPEIELLRERAHRGALEGITLTAIGVGARADMQSLGALAQAGQGRRRVLDDVNRARATLEEELSASGRVVARAVRLRIRLQKGVKLIRVLGSHPLAEEVAERVRQVEQAVDFKVAETLGIESDRGQDEDGIQIVIPAYYAGDDHAVLLDVVAPGPGKIADVRVRYKDLVNLRNAVARAGLTLPAGRQPDNPLSRNVKKNVLAHHLSGDLLQAGILLESGREEEARQVLTQSLSRIQELRNSHPAFADDPELARDVSMLTGYRGVISHHGEWCQKPQIRTHLVDSLAYAGRMKIPPGVH